MLNLFVLLYIFILSSDFQLMIAHTFPKLSMYITVKRLGPSETNSGLW